MSDERRRAKRQRVEYLATMVTSRGSPSHYCLVTELSEGGIRIKAIGYSVPDEFGLRLSGHAVPKHYRVIRYGYRKIAALLRQAGWSVSDGRVERIWRREGPKVPRKQPKRGRLWLTDGTCIRLRPERPNHVWSYDFVEDRTHDGRRYRMLNVIDEFTHECLAICINRKLKAIDVIDVLSDLFILRGVPGHIRSDNGAEFVAKAVREWIAAVGAKMPIEHAGEVKQCRLPIVDQPACRRENLAAGQM